jgi:peptide/nickel transport system ATP-binding protein
VPELREAGGSLVACHLVADDGTGPDVRLVDNGQSAASADQTETTTGAPQR